MEEVLSFIKRCGVFFIATAEGDQPRVRPFAGISKYEGKLYFGTHITKKVAKQLQNNPKFEICGFTGEEWIRLSGTAVLDERNGAKEAMLIQNPSVNSVSSLEDGIFVVYYIKEGVADFQSFKGKNVTIYL